MEEKRRPEILAPAGSMESLKAAVAAGCDAVYMGGSRFGARAFADNPQGDEFIDAIRYCHLYGVKIYLTVNTLLKETELREELFRYLLPCYQEGVDAVIVQDVGVMRYLHRHFPGLPIHASTQMTLTMGKSTRLLEEYGVTRIVPARELTLRELQQMRRDTGLELEVFVHGALCYCYSGQCLFSSMLGGRSGNRGRCAQPCRMPYCMEGDFRQGKRGYNYIFSLKENCNLAHVGELVDAGVDSFKIEGRMKRPEYTAFTTAMYRKYVDLYMELGREAYEQYIRANRKQWSEDMRKLAELYNRSGFTDGYLEGKAGVPNIAPLEGDVSDRNHPRKGEMLSALRPRHGGVRIGEVNGVDSRTFSFVAERDLHPQDVVEVRDNRQKQIYEYTLGEEKRTGQSITARYQKGCKILPGNLVYRTKDAALLEDIQRKYIQREAKIVLQAEFLGKENEKMILELVCRRENGQDIRLRTEGEVCQKAQKQPFTEENVRKLICQTGDTPFAIDGLRVRLEGELFLPVKAVKQLRRQALADMRHALEQEGRRSHQPLPSGSKSLEETGGEKNIIRIASVLTWEQFQTAASLTDVAAIYLKMDQMTDRQLGEAVREGSLAGKEMYLVLPAIFRSGVYEAEKKKLSGGDSLYQMEQLRGFVIRNMESFVFLRDEAGVRTEDIITDSNLYVTNRESIAYWREQGCHQVTLPLELTERELRDLSGGLPGQAFDDVEKQAVVYGHISLMISAQCVRHNTQGCGEMVGFDGGEQKKAGMFVAIQDTREREFFVFNACKYCYNVIYQGEPLVYGREKELLLEQGVRRFRYDFSVEMPEEMGRILAGELPSGHTGHFYHGID